jgi:hypothetical protein
VVGQLRRATALPGLCPGWWKPGQLLRRCERTPRKAALANVEVFASGVVVRSSFFKKHTQNRVG